MAATMDSTPAGASKVTATVAVGTSTSAFVTPSSALTAPSMDILQ